jgi:hypothetical protein
MNRTKNLGLVAVIAASVALLMTPTTGCDGRGKDSDNKDSQEQPYYPTNIATNGEQLSSASTIFFSENYVGLDRFGIYPKSLYDARWLTDSGSFTYLNGHTGGIGKTFQVVNYSEGIQLCWAGGSLDSAYLFGAWQGRVFEGNIMLRDSLDKVRQAYPSLREDSIPGIYDREFVKSITDPGSRFFSADIFLKDYTNYNFRTFNTLTFEVKDNLVRGIRVGERYEHY